MIKWHNDPAVRVADRLDWYKSFPVPNRGNDQLTQADLRNTIALIEHLVCCHRASLEVPGISSALATHPFESPIDGEIKLAGIHCDRAYSFVEDLLRTAQRWCAEQIKQLPPAAQSAPGAIDAPTAGAQLLERGRKRSNGRLKR